LAAFSAFFASFFIAASERQPAFVPLLEPSAGVPTTQMHAEFPPHAASSSPLQDAAALAFLTFGFAGAAVA
jgi:hypothetical protein